MSWNESEGILRELGFDGLQHRKTVQSAVTTAWGVDWDADLVARDLLQNFFDADRHRVNEIKITIGRSEIRVSSPSDYNLERLYFLGSEKGSDDIGKYGEGFKAAAMCVLRDHGTVIAAASKCQVLRIRIADAAVADTQLYPLEYDFFTSSQPIHGNLLIIRGVSKKLSESMEHGLTHFFHADNPLLGEKLTSDERGFLVFRSKAPDGHIFYRNLKRGVIPDLPLVLVLGGEDRRVEKKIGSDRDRKAFGDNLRNLFYEVWAERFFKDNQRRQRIAVEAARESWQRGKGHPLLAEIAKRPRWGYGCWDAKTVGEVFQDQYFAGSHARETNVQLEYDSIEREWRKQGRTELPGYFTRFGVVSAEAHLREIESKARQEARDREHRALTVAEARAVEVLTAVLRGLAPEVMAIFAKGQTSYSVAKTDVVLGELRQKRGYRSREVFLAEDVFALDFPSALAVFLHEHSHVFGHDGSRGFTDALTELLEVVVRHRSVLDDHESRWHSACAKVAAERETAEPSPTCNVDRLDSMSEPELRTLLHNLPPAVLERLLADHGATPKSQEPVVGARRPRAKRK